MLQLILFFMFFGEIVEAVEEEQPPESVEFTDTSYTSASFESITDGGISFTSLDRRSLKGKAKRKKKSARRQSDRGSKTELTEFKWSDEDFDLTIGADAGTRILEPEPEIIIPEEPPFVFKVYKKEGKKKKESKKAKKKKEAAIPDFPKPPEWRVMRKAERDMWLANRIIEWEHEMEEKKQQELANIKQKRKDLADARAALKIQDEAEMKTRSKMLKVIFKHFEEFNQEKLKNQAIQTEKEEWKRLILCDGTPNPHVTTELYQFLEFWNNEVDKYDPENVQSKLKIVFPIMNKLNQFITGKRYSENQNEIFEELLIEFRKRLADIIEMLAYFLLRDLEKNLTWQDSSVLTYQREYKILNLNLWVAVKKFTIKHPPTRSQLLMQSSKQLRGRSIPKELRSSIRSIHSTWDIGDKPLELEFPGVKVTITLPLSFGQTDLCVRAAKFDLDIMSEFSRTWKLPALMPDRNLDLLQMNELEHTETYRLKQKYDLIREEYYRNNRRKIKDLQMHIKMFPYLRHDDIKEEIDRLHLAEPPLVSGAAAEDPRLVVNSQYERAFNRYLNAMNITLRIGEINLRKYRILNGMLNLDVLEIPPQPKRCPFQVFLTTVEPPRCLRLVAYHVRYRAPPPPDDDDPRTADQIHAEAKYVRAQLQKLVLITIELPAEVMFFENPVVCQWYAAKTMWTNVYINDYKYDRETNILQFRTGILWPMAFAASQYSNHPLLSWDIQPRLNRNSGVYVTIEGVFIKLTFLVKGLRIRLVSVEKYPQHTLEDIIGKSMSIVNLQKVLQSRGCFIFPAPDCFLYVEHSCPKVSPMERHNYHVMALLARGYGFRMSRWNAKAGYRDIVLQIREMYNPKYVFKWDLLRVTPGYATLLKTREENMPYNEETEQYEINYETIYGMQFCPDLFSIAVKYGSIDAKRKIYYMQYPVTETLSEFITSLKLCSF